MSAQKPVCVVCGAGVGIGGHVGKRFAADGYHAVLARRSDADGLARIVAEIETAGGTATGRLLVLRTARTSRVSTSTRCLAASLLIGLGEGRL